MPGITQQIQKEEKEKLTLVASSHLDKIVTAYPTLKGHIGVEVQPDSSYVSTRVLEVEAEISEYLEAILMEKCEMLKLLDP